MKFSQSNFNSNKFSPSVSKYKPTNAKHGVNPDVLPRISKCPTVPEDVKYHPVSLERSMMLIKPIVEPNATLVEKLTIETPPPLPEPEPELEPLFEAPKSIISRVDELNVEMLIVEEPTHQTKEVVVENDCTGLSLPHIYEPKEQVVTMQENPLRKFGRKISVKDTVSMVISHNRCRKYSETNGWNT